MLPVGGIKNKVLAARRAGLKRIVLPAKNEKDLEEVPEQAREGLEFVFVNNIEEVLKVALGADRKRARRRKRAKASTAAKRSRGTGTARKKPSAPRQP